jgi:hypothetical protein
MRMPISRARVESIIRPKSDCAIIPQKQRHRTPIRQFRTVCVRNYASSNRTSYCRQSYDGRKSTAEVSSTGLRLWRERVDHSVHSSPCALHHTSRNVIRGRQATRHLNRHRCTDEKPETLNQRQGLYRRLRRIRPCRSEAASHLVWRKKRSALRAACHYPARHATSQVRRRHNAWLSLIPEQFGSRVFS